MRFSIITCTYNSADYIQKNIDSIKSQSFSDFEHIFIDGFSTDDTVEIIKKYQEEFPQKVKLFQYQPRGIANAMNEGIKKAKGKYIMHLHSDDSMYDKEVLKDINSFLIQKNNPDWIYGKIKVVKKEGQLVGIFPKKLFLQQTYKSPLGCYLLKFINFVPHQSVFIKKSIFKKFGCFNEDLRSSMDFDLWLRIKNSTSWMFFDRLICNYMIRSDAQSSGRNNEIENKKNLKKVHKEHLGKMEFKVAQIINFFLHKKNKTIIN